MGPQLPSLQASYQLISSILSTFRLLKKHDPFSSVTSLLSSFTYPVSDEPAVIASCDTVSRNINRTVN